jgi:hypothetical protein
MEAWEVWGGIYIKRDMSLKLIITFTICVSKWFIVNCWKWLSIRHNKTLNSWRAFGNIWKAGLCCLQFKGKSSCQDSCKDIFQMVQTGKPRQITKLAVTWMKNIYNEKYLTIFLKKNIQHTVGFTLLLGSDVFIWLNSILARKFPIK